MSLIQKNLSYSEYSNKNLVMNNQFVYNSNMKQSKTMKSLEKFVYIDSS